MKKLNQGMFKFNREVNVISSHPFPGKFPIRWNVDLTYTKNFWKTSDTFRYFGKPNKQTAEMIKKICFKYECAIRLMTLDTKGPVRFDGQCYGPVQPRDIARFLGKYA